MSENVPNEENSSANKKTVGFKVTPHMKTTYSNNNTDFTNKRLKSLIQKNTEESLYNLQSVYSSVLQPMLGSVSIHNTRATTTATA